ncbi:TerD family protein [Streptomyces goshikiensis]|uniref:TerD family protein n=1 Tax=Streptomyces goshikiensis TaxID=1942 RepID=UPI0036B9E77D
MTFTSVDVGVSWDRDADFDMSAVVLGSTGKIYDDEFRVTSSHRFTPGFALTHYRSGEADTDCGGYEFITADFSRLPNAVAAVAFQVHAFGGLRRVQNASFRIVHIRADGSLGEEAVNFTLSEHATTAATAMVVGEFRRSSTGPEWEFRALLESYDSHASMLEKYGII